jgi:hypothetical protein
MRARWRVGAACLQRLALYDLYSFRLTLVALSAGPRAVIHGLQLALRAVAGLQAESISAAAQQSHHVGVTKRHVAWIGDVAAKKNSVLEVSPNPRSIAEAVRPDSH